MRLKIVINVADFLLVELRLGEKIGWQRQSLVDCQKCLGLVLVILPSRLVVLRSCPLHPKRKERRLFLCR